MSENRTGNDSSLCEMESADEEPDFEAGRRERNDFTGCNTP